ncbi:MAG: CCA tRNA nucleotidyltransferase [Halobacteria archaeon]
MVLPPQLRTRLLSRLRPTPAEESALRSAVETLFARARGAARSLGLQVEPLHVGSSARSTWRRGERDIDIFLLFPPGTPREDLEQRGLALARKVCPKGRVKYAEHPYLRGQWEGFGVDLVPAYKLESAAERKTAVDRTPFHHDHVKRRVAGREEEVLLLKQHLAGAGVYGAEAKTRGFSGYLCELLILHFGSFEKCVEAMAKWRPPVHLDSEGEGTFAGEDPLVFIDPVDPGRNVAAALSRESLARAVEHARALLRKPSLALFFPEPPAPLKPGELGRRLRARGTEMTALVLPAPDRLVDDTVYPQLRRAEESLTALLKKNEFHIFRSGVHRIGGRGFVLFELPAAPLPRLRLHEGPPLFFEGDSRRFLKAHGGRPRFMRGDRWVVELERKHRTVPTFLEAEAKRAGLGRDLAKGRFEVWDSRKIERSKELREFLGGYFAGREPV